jgi:hypothetical protein
MRFGEDKKRLIAWTRERWLNLFLFNLACSTAVASAGHFVFYLFGWRRMEMPVLIFWIIAMAASWTYMRQTTLFKV